MHLNEITKSSDLVYQAKIFHVTKDTAELEDGKIVQRDVVHHSGGVCVVPLTERQTVLMVQQYRYPFHEVTLEIPAGKREPGEDPLECGLRELREEVGRTCKKYTELGYLYPTPAYDTEVIHMYLAEDLSAPMQQDLDAGEFLDVLELPLEEVVTMIMDGKIADAKTQLAILKTWALLQIQGKNKDSLPILCRLSQNQKSGKRIKIWFPIKHAVHVVQPLFPLPSVPGAVGRFP